VLRPRFGTRADRSGGHWRMTIAGDGLTAVRVPQLGVTRFWGQPAWPWAKGWS
jgi:hypothetical protein